jgi:uncharacterized surface protein with fasciclin (FAS1) repeats
MNRQTLLIGLLALTLAALSSSCAGPARERMRAESGELPIVATAMALADCGRFAAMVRRAGLHEELDKDGPMTVFVPIDAAWLRPSDQEQLRELQDKESLRQLLLRHIVPSEVRAERLIRLTELQPVAGRPLRIQIAGDRVMIDNAHVVRGDYPASNGIIHFVDALFRPE